MIRDTLIGLILLACLGIAGELLGPTGTLVASAACATGFLAREVYDRRRRELADRRARAVMNRNRERMGMPPLAPSTIVVDERLARPMGFAPTNVGYQAVERPVAPRNRMVREGVQPDRPWPR